MTPLPPPDRKNAIYYHNKYGYRQTGVRVIGKWVRWVKPPPPPPPSVRQQHVDTCQCPTSDFDDTEWCRRCFRLDLRAPQAAALAAAYDARHRPNDPT